jgi:hypothetical protein
VSRILLNSLAELKVSYPKTTPARLAELQSIRKLLQK